MTESRGPIGDMPMLIGGDLVASESGRWMDSIDPATEEVLGRVPQGTAQDVDRAVAAAEKAQPGWAALSIAERAGYLHRVADALEARAADILRIEVLDTGNTIAKMRADVGKASAQIRLFAGLGGELKGSTIPATAGNLHFTLREPYGVVGRIMPFNHPINFAASRMAAPLIAGNTMVGKPSDQSPLSAGILARMAAEVLPPGVLNIVTGTGAEAGAALARHPRVKRLAFTGSVQTGMAVQRIAAEGAVKAVTLELGGKNPMSVFPDADYDRALAAAVAGMNLGVTGQSCSSITRLFLHEDLHDRFLADLAGRVSRLRVGDPMADDTQMGPVNSRAQYEKVMSHIEAARAEGARLVTGGKRPPGAQFARGFWVEPTIFADVTPEMQLAREEVFGPVLAVFRWSDLEETVAIANSLHYGLTGAVWTRDLGRALHTARRLQSGHVWVNGTAGRYRGVPFGGYRNSGHGREESLDELLSYTEEKAVNVILG